MTYDEFMKASDIDYDRALEVLHTASDAQLEHFLSTTQDDGTLTEVVYSVLEKRRALRVEERAKKAHSLNLAMDVLHEAMSTELDPLLEGAEDMTDGEIRYLLDTLPGGFHRGELYTILNRRGDVRVCLLEGTEHTVKTYQNRQPFEGEWLRILPREKGVNYIDVTVTKVNNDGSFEAVHT